MPRYRRRTTSYPRRVTQSYKQVKYEAPASVAAATANVHTIATGVDNYTGPSAANSEVPTGAIIKAIDIQYTVVNLVSIASTWCLSIQQIRSGQTEISPLTVGGSPLRNQVFMTVFRNVGKDQNCNVHVRFKIPQKFQRVREGTTWKAVTDCTTIRTESAYYIYKFFR